MVQFEKIFRAARGRKRRQCPEKEDFFPLLPPPFFSFGEQEKKQLSFWASAQKDSFFSCSPKEKKGGGRRGKNYTSTGAEKFPGLAILLEFLKFP